MIPVPPAPERVLVGRWVIWDAIDRVLDVIWAGAAYGAAVGVVALGAAVCVGYLIGRARR